MVGLEEAAAEGGVRDMANRSKDAAENKGGKKLAVRNSSTGEFKTVVKGSKVVETLQTGGKRPPAISLDTKKPPRGLIGTVRAEAFPPKGRITAGLMTSVDPANFRAFFNVVEEKTQPKKPAITDLNPATYQTNDDAMAERFQADPTLVEDMLNMILEEGDQGELLGTLRQIAMAKGMAKIAEQTDLNRSQLYRTLSEHGNPSLNNFIAILKAMGLRLSVQQIASAD